MDIVRDGQLEATNYFFSLGDDENVLELTFNHDGRTYELGTGYGHIAIGVDDLDGTLAALRSRGSSPSGRRTRCARAATSSASCAIRTTTGSNSSAAEIGARLPAGRRLARALGAYHRRVADEDWRVEVELNDEAQGFSLRERLRALDLDDEARMRLGSHVTVTRDGSRLFLYAALEEQANVAARVVRGNSSTRTS